ncbi:MAG: hypothetical protein ACI4FZ_05880 [Lachnospiraceae bacterium]
MEKEYEVLNPSETEEQEMAQDWNREAFSQYEYFNFDTIRQNGNFQTQAENKGRELLAQKKLKIDSVDVGYTSEGEQVAEAVGTGQERSYPFRLHLVISRDRILHAGCECYECTRSYYRTHYYGSRCAFISGMLEYVKEYVGKHRLGDTTDYNGQVLLQAFREQHANAVISSSFEKQNPVRLVPRLVQKEGGLQLSFKVGQQKLFVVKNLREFYDNVKYSRTEQYGNDT